MGLVGGMWLEPDLNMPDGEVAGAAVAGGPGDVRGNCTASARCIGWNPDSFGYNWQLPQIYKRSGIDYFVTQKMFWNDTNNLPLKLFWWESPDGKVLTYFPLTRERKPRPRASAKTSRRRGSFRRA